MFVKSLSVSIRACFAAIAAACLMLAGPVAAQINLPPGSLVTPPGVTVGGAVIYDQLVPFEIRAATGALLYKANLQDRINRYNATDLGFSCRIRDVQPGLNGIIARIERLNFSNYTCRAHYEPSSSGTVVPNLASRSAGNGAQVGWRYSPGIASSQESKFAYISTDAVSYNVNGLTTITLTTGESVVIPTTQPGAGNVTAIITSPGPFGCGCNPITITGTANASSGFAGYTLEYSPNAGGPWTTIITSGVGVTNGTLANWNTTGVASGDYFVRLRASNTDGVEVNFVTFLRVDNSPPGVDLRAPVDSGLYGGYICFDGTVTDNCFSNYILQYRLPPSLLYTTFLTSNTQVINDPLGQLNANAFPDGNVDVRLVATDSCGRSTTVGRRIVIDNTSPIARIRNPINCDTVRGIVRVTGTAFDANLSAWSLSVTGGPYNDFVVIATGTTNIVDDILALWDTRELPACCYTLRLAVTDRANVNCSTSHRTDFYTSVEVGDPFCGADFNNDGGVDGADVQAFFDVWSNGGCLP